MRNDQNILKGPPLKRDWTYKSIGEYFLEKLIENGNSRALMNADTGEELNYKQLLDKSLKLSISLGKLGLKPDDRIGISSENSVNYGVTILASIFLGTALCPLNPNYTEREAFHVLTISKPKYIIVSPLNLSKMQKVVKKLAWSPKLILSYPVNNSGISSISQLVSRVSNLELKNFKLREIDINDHVLLIPCSSGTTGFPKGVMLTDKNILTIIQQHHEDESPLINEGENILGLLPMFHGYALCVFLFVISFNSNLIILSKFEERYFLSSIEKYKINILTIVPPIMVFLAKSPMVDEYDLSSVKKIICGAAPLSEEIEEMVKKRFNLSQIDTGYGLTEITLTVTISPKKNKRKSVGILQSGVMAKVLPLEGPSDKALGAYSEGELCFKSGSVMKGYCANEEATRAIIDKDGFLHTGDVGYYDEDGYFYIVDRVKELIKYKGFQVAPAELESLLLSHPAIKDAAVVGLPDELAGELPLAFVVKQPGAEITAEEIIKFVNEQVSVEKRLRGGVRFLNQIPKNPSGKILRRELRKNLKSNL